MSGGGPGGPGGPGGEPDCVQRVPLWRRSAGPRLCAECPSPPLSLHTDYGIAFHVNTSDGLHDEWSAAVLALQEQGNLQTLRETWITSPLAGCAQQTKISSGAEPVHFIDM